MHTWQSLDQEGDRPLAVIHHNGDHSGDAKITVASSRADSGVTFSTPYGSREAVTTIEIPCSILRDFVLSWLEDERIARLEDQTYESRWRELIG